MDKNSAVSCIDLNLLPDLALEQVVKKLYSGVDFLNLLQVFPVGSCAEKIKETKHDWMFEIVLPALLPYLKFKDVVECRLVSGRWKRAIDNALANMGLAEPDYTKTFEEMEPISLFVEHAWSGDWSARLRFTEEMNRIGHFGNPFPSRAVCLGNLDTKVEAYNVNRFLERFGQHIWKLTLSMRFSSQDATKILQSFLQRTPNLRCLQVEQFPNLKKTNNKFKKNRLNRLEVFPFPTLPHLRQVGWCLCPPFFKFGIREYAYNLVRLEIQNENNGFLENYESRVDGTFPNLKMLKVFLSDIDEMIKLTEMQSPLRNLEVISADRIPLSDQLEICQHFAKTLQCMALEFDADLGYDERNLIHYNFENKVWEFLKLENLSLANVNPMESLDVLLAIKPGPKILHIKADHIFLRNLDLLFQKMEGEAIQIHGYLENLYASAIWEKIPRLETVNVAVSLEREGEREELLLKKVYARADLMEVDE